METTILAKLPVSGALLMATAAFAIACGGGAPKLTVLTPTPITQAAANAITPEAAIETKPATQVIPPTSDSVTQAVAPTPEPPAATESPTESSAESPENSLLELRLIIMKRAPDDTVTVLEEGGVLTADDFYGIYFEPVEDSWVYILQQDSSAAIDVLFPNPDFSDYANPVPAGTAVWIPKDVNNWFFLDQNIGTESFFVVASKERNQELETIIAGHQREVLLGPLAGFLQSDARGVGGSKKLEKEPKLLPDGSTLELEQQLLQGEGDNFVYSLRFEHK